MKHFFLPLAAVLLLACGPTEPKETTTEPAETPPPAPEVQSPPATASVLPGEVTDAVATALPDWQIVGEAEWLEPATITQRNEGKPPEQYTTYSQDIFIQSDFNGDQLDDFATFVINAENKVKLFAFHGTANGFQAVEVADLGTLDGCCLGAGLQAGAPGVYNIMDDADIPRSWKSEHGAIIYRKYGQSAKIYKLDTDGAYSGVNYVDE